MNFNEADEAIRDAEKTLQSANKIIRQLAVQAQGRLRSARVPSYVLAELKRELRNFNLTTCCWKD